MSTPSSHPLTPDRLCKRKAQPTLPRRLTWEPDWLLCDFRCDVPCPRHRLPVSNQRANPSRTSWILRCLTKTSTMGVKMTRKKGMVDVSLIRGQHQHKCSQSSFILFFPRPSPIFSGTISLGSLSSACGMSKFRWTCVSEQQLSLSRSFQTWWRYRRAAPMAVTVVTVGIKWLAWPVKSSTTVSVSKPSDSGSFIKLTLIVSQRSFGISSGLSSPYSWGCCIFVRKHMSHVRA